MAVETSSKKFVNFDWMRLFLALEVVAVHSYGFDTKMWSNWRNPIPPVPVFLALSGYLILKSYEQSRSVWHFWWKRALRILPAFLLSLLLVFSMFGLGGLLEVLRVYFTAGVYSEGPNTPVWSLSTEEIIYVLMVCAATLGLFKSRRLMLVCIVAAFISSAALISFSYDSIKWCLLPIAFLIGCYCYKWKAYMPLGLAWGAIVMVSLTTLFWNTGYWEWRAPLNVVLCSAAFISIGRGPQLSWRLPADLSYGIYVYHFPILCYLADVLKVHGRPLWVIGACLTFTVALISYQLVERPALSLKDRRRRVEEPVETPATAPVYSSV